MTAFEPATWVWRGFAVVEVAAKVQLQGLLAVLGVSLPQVVAEMVVLP